MKQKPDLLHLWITARDYHGNMGALIGLISGFSACLLLFMYPGYTFDGWQRLAGFSVLAFYSLWAWLYHRASHLSIEKSVQFGRLIGLGLGSSWLAFLVFLARPSETPSPHFRDLVLVYAIGLVSAFPSTFRSDRLVARYVIGAMGLAMLSIGYFKFAKIDYFIYFSATLVYLGYTIFNSESRYNTDIKLLRQQRRLEQIFDAFPGGVSFLKDLHYQTVNKYLRQHIPTADTMTERQLGFHNPQDPWVSQVRNFAFSSNKQIIFEAPVHTRAGHRMHLTSATKIAKDEIVLISVDIQDLVDARNEIESQKARNVANAKLVSLGEMGAGIAHEINNPLAVLKGRLSLLEKALQQDPLDREKITNHITKLLPMANRIEKIVRSMRNLCRTGDLDTELTPTPLKSILDESLVFMEARLKNYGAEIRLEGDALEAQVLAVESQIVQVIVNALANSHDAIQNLAEKWVIITAIDLGEQIQIRIQDSGQGIQKEVRDKIGQPFFTTKAPGKGTGLGLSISRTIIEKHGGRLEFDHEQPHTTLNIWLPKVQGVAGAHAA